MKITGVDRVKERLRTTFSTIADQKTDRAVYAILATGRNYADTITPQELGNLLNSGYAPIIEHMPDRVVGVIGYSAEYAAAVHNASGILKGQQRASGRGNYWDPQGEPQFLTKGFEAIKADVPVILKRIYSDVS